MRFSTAAALLSTSLGSTKAFLIPDGQPSGVYTVHVYENGTEHHVRIADALGNDEIPANYTMSAASMSPRKRRSLAKRWDTPCYSEEIWPNEQDMDHESLLRATALLDAQIPGNNSIAVRYGHHLYSIDHCVVAYFCSFAKHGWAYPMYATAEERRTCWGMLDALCGEWHPGGCIEQRFPENSYHHPEVAYGREVYCTAKGHKFCGSGIHG